MAVVPLDGGRMNILTVGTRRYSALRYIEKESYLKAEVEFISDTPDDYNLESLTEEVKKLYLRAAKALKELNDEQTLPTELPDNPEDFSFAIAAVLQLPLEKKQPCLETRSTGLRLTKLRQHLSTLIKEYEDRANLHSKAKRNGHGSSEVLKTLKEEFKNPENKS
jgi:Lon protease-like protein